MNYLYKNWAFMTLPIAVFSAIILFSSFSMIGWIAFLVWMQFPVYLIHQFEEHAYPGGFKDYINRNVFNSKKEDTPLNDKDVFWINIPIIWFLFPLAAVLSQTLDPQIGVFLPVFGLFNASTHLIAACVKRMYNPGFFVSLIVNFPTGIFTLLVMKHQNFLGFTSFILAVLSTILLHLAMIAYIKMK
jgi:hypothetical protein